ncbi:MAG: ATP-dependent DNA helicase RecG [Bradymonadaceae bacterium]|nr:ATP-dependent DNA helicase RecG [Lujinxingiaceae bacterium]
MEVTAGRFQLVTRDAGPFALEKLKGVGPKIATRLKERGIVDQLELLLYVPRKYRPIYRHFPGPELARRKSAYIECIGQITQVKSPGRHSRTPLEVSVDCQGQSFRLIWFNMNHRDFIARFKPGRWMHIEGGVDHDQQVPTLAHPNCKSLAEPPAVLPEPTVSIEPIYPSIEGINDALFAKAIAQAAEHLLPQLVEIVPAPVLARHGLSGVGRALRTIHLLDAYSDLDFFRAELQGAKDRLVFEEFYTLQLKMAEQYVSERRAARAPRCTERDLGRELVRRLPFALTGDQSAAIACIADDLARRTPMRRLLQGDVGSGKTIVALMAAAIAIGSGYQVALMAPTDILARQHCRRTQEFLADLPIAIDSLTGSQSAPERRAVLEALAAGATHLVIGTHALFQQDVRFKALGLVIIDEQHKFGVAQRDLLLQKGEDPHLLAMTATPIPRSLAHAVFGDLDLTVIGEKPPGRKPVRTLLRTRASAAKVYQYVRERIIETGEQAYFVYPMIEAGELETTRRNVLQAAEQLAQDAFADLRLAILHGRLDATTKDAVMQRFAQGEIDVLCATTVVEVGMDVQNATIMVIESPEVFGLSQLHQLRGRVGRGSQESMCILLSGELLTDDAHARLTAFGATDDGFLLAETDLRIRGPGQFLGMRQAGVAEFRFGDILRDSHLLEEARQDARRQILGDAAG